MVWLILLGILSYTCALPLPFNGANYNITQTPENIERDGFPAEVHHVTTSDGYILEMHRIPHGRNQVYTEDRPVVLLMHGILTASNSWLILGPERAPAYNLADAGFDVWMGNARGTRNSRYHTTMDPDDRQEKFDFFDFSFEEIGTLDLPAMIDYALAHTGKEKLHYVGHSQGGTVFLVLNSMRPEYNEKIVSAHLLAGVGYQNNFPNTALAAVARLTDTLYRTVLLAGLVEVFSPNFPFPSQASDEARGDRCFGDEQYKHICEQIGVKYLLSENEDIPPSAFDGYLPAGAAIKQAAHFGQNVRDRSFSRWNYGTIENLIIYGTRNPPAYDLSLITVKTTMHYTVSDFLLDERDVHAMAREMQHTEARRVERESFSHEDFVAAFDAKEMVTDHVVAALLHESGIAF